jgi:hypothetical protein
MQQLVHAQQCCCELRASRVWWCLTSRAAPLTAIRAKRPPRPCASFAHRGLCTVCGREAGRTVEPTGHTWSIFAFRLEKCSLHATDPVMLLRMTRPTSTPVGVQSCAYVLIHLRFALDSLNILVVLRAMRVGSTGARRGRTPARVSSQVRRALAAREPQETRIARPTAAGPARLQSPMQRRQRLAKRTLIPAGCARRYEGHKQFSRILTMGRVLMRTATERAAAAVAASAWLRLAIRGEHGEWFAPERPAGGPFAAASASATRSTRSVYFESVERHQPLSAQLRALARCTLVISELRATMSGKRNASRRHVQPPAVRRSACSEPRPAAVPPPLPSALSAA